MPMIMISYRRADAPDMAGRISDHLSTKYGEKNVFFDFNSIPTGANYRKRIEKAIVNSNVVIVIIGQHWLGKNADGKPSRMADASDNVRVELDTAMKHAKPILPLLVNGAVMPAESEFPDSLKELASYNAGRVDSGQDFRMHMTHLVDSIEATLTENSPADSAVRPTRFWYYGASALGAAAAIAALVWFGIVPFTARFTSASITKNPATAPESPSPGISPAVMARAKANGGFLFADSDTRLLSEDDLKNLSLEELRIARNEIFARRGRFFVDIKLASYFAQFSWYRPRQVEVELSALESTNVNTIQLAEHRK
jgi:hypothetical protein